jgi:hypothetical protein
MKVMLASWQEGDVLPLQLLGSQIDLGLENLWGGLSHLGGDDQRGAADVMEIGRLQDVLHTLLAALKELLDDQIMAHGVHPTEKE